MSKKAAKTVPKQLEPHQWKPGQSGNPNGRPKGSKQKLGEDFFRDLSDAWETHGKPALQDMVARHPDKFVQCIAGLMPKEFKSESENRHYVVSDQPMSADEWKDEFAVEPAEGTAASTH